MQRAEIAKLQWGPQVSPELSSSYFWIHFSSPFWYVEFGGNSYIFGKYVDLCSTTIFTAGCQQPDVWEIKYQDYVGIFCHIFWQHPLQH